MFRVVAASPGAKGERLPSRVGAVPIDTDEEVPAARLRGGYADEHLSGREPAFPAMIGPIAASNLSITPCRSHSSFTAAVAIQDPRA